MNITTTCGSCHNEESNIPMREGLRGKSYPDGIHERGLNKRGIKVTATCISCHGAHAILRYSDKRSSISRENSAATCSKCHGQLEQIHVKVIKRGIWKAQGSLYPVCVDCHDPHKGFEHSLSRAEFSDRSCMVCHGDTANAPASGPKPPRAIHTDDVKASAHHNLPCIQCHVDVSKKRSPVCAGSGRVICASCHAEAAEMYEGSIHGVLKSNEDKDAPSCVDCHGTHRILSKESEASPISRLNSPNLCGRCHQLGAKAEVRDKNKKGMFEKYKVSVHGKGLVESGLKVTAICVDCHSTHGERRTSDTASTVNPKNIANTCSKCHSGIYEAFIRGVHSPEITKTDKRLPVCSDCHPAHNIMRVEGNEFRQTTMMQCGSCHKDVAETYFETFHGKGSRLGYNHAAKCSDCHGAHEIYKPSDTRSGLNSKKIASTCRKCHPNASPGFARYQVHASPGNKSRNPILFYTFWAMNLLLLGVFTFFGIHTALWFPRSFREFLRERRNKHKQSTRWVRRFSPFYSILHICVIISFLSLALTGMTLKFADTEWARVLSAMFGGTQGGSIIHRIGAIVTFGYFVFHLVELTLRIIREKLNLWDFLFLRESMIPSKRDVVEFFQSVKWFVGKGPRPVYGRWTYWEKFDYFAVFWGVAIIGVSGLILWFPEFFTRFLPGWIINIAMLIHSDEALLAVGFIFTIHFFNTHFRPEKFPMDTVIFSGKVPFDVFVEERPREYEDLMKAGALERLIEPPPSKTLMTAARIFGTIALTIGLVLIGLVAWGMLFRYIIK
jgi:cytochrome b subunit of formate dehydrogenase